MLDNFIVKVPFAHNYFSNMLKQVFSSEKKFPQAIIFEGNDTKLQYLFSLELARILNCQNKEDDNCNCINCKWIKGFSHPCVNNVSQIHFKPEGDETKTIISTKQAQEIEKTLCLSSDYHRFFIFFSSGEYEYTKEELSDFENLGYDTNKINFKIEPLDYKTFHPTTLNALLKSVEEPPERTTFIFLTKSKENILPTIVSRCLVFKLNGKKESPDYSDIKGIVSDYFNMDYEGAFEISQNLQDYIKETQNSTEAVLNMFMEYLKDLIKENLEDDSLYLKIKNDIMMIKQAIDCSRANMSDKTVLDTLFLKLARGY